MVAEDSYVFAGSYERYKTATREFTDWVRTTGAPVGHHRAGKTVGQLEAAVKLVVQRGVSIPKAVLRSMDDCISLRELMHQFHLKHENLAGKGEATSFEESNQKHKYFIEKLKKWRSLISVCSSKPSEKAKQRTEENSSSIDNADSPGVISNRFDSLSLEEETNGVVDDGKNEWDGDYNSTSESSDGFWVDSAELTDALVCLFNDMTTLMDRVESTWKRVKKDELSYIVASVVTNAAVRSIIRICGDLQLRFPYLNSFESIVNGAQKYFPWKIGGYSKLLQHVNICKLTEDQDYDEVMQDPEMKRFLDEQASEDCTLDSFPVVRFTPTFEALMSFTTAFSDNPGNSLLPRDEILGPFYHENYSPAYSKIDSLRFLLYELGSYYNVFGVEGMNPSIDQEFFPMLKRYFDKCEISVEFVFAVECWVTSVLALQGNSGLSRTYYLTKQLVRDLHSRTSDCIDCAGNMGPNYVKAFKKLLGRHNIREMYREARVLQRNPWLCGMISLHSMFEYNILGCELLHTTTRVQSLLHLYHALIQEAVISRNMFFEYVLSVFQERILELDSHRLVSRGSYVKAWNMSISANIKIDEDFRRKRREEVAAMFRSHRGFRLELMSKLFVFFERDICVEAVAVGSSMDVNSFMDIVEQMTVDDLHENQIVSLDMVKLVCSAWKALEFLKDALDVDDIFQQCTASYDSSFGIEFEYFRNSALDRVVVGGMLSGLDVGVVHPKLAGAFQTALDRFFADPSQFFFLNKKQSLITKTFHSIDLPSPLKSDGEDEEYYEFEDLMDELEDATTLTQELETKIKTTVLKFPIVTRMVYSGSLDYPTLVHHAAGNPSIDRDPSLLDWLLQMGADFFLFPKYSKVVKTPLHLAAARGNYTHCQIMVYHARHSLFAQDEDGNTPLHCAANADISFMFRMQGADPLAQNNFGKTPLDLSPSEESRLLLSAFSEMQREIIQNKELHRDRTPLLLQGLTIRAKQTEETIEEHLKVPKSKLKRKKVKKLH
jgi:hypothetical protein